MFQAEEAAGGEAAVCWGKCIQSTLTEHRGNGTERKLEEPVIWRLCWDSGTLSRRPCVYFVCLLSCQGVSWSSKSLIRNWQILYFQKLTWAEVWRMDWMGRGKNRGRDILWVSQVGDESLNSGRVVKGRGTYLRNLEEVHWARHVVEWLWREKKGIKNSESRSRLE